MFLARQILAQQRGAVMAFIPDQKILDLFHSWITSNWAVTRANLSSSLGFRQSEIQTSLLSYRD